ncbi:MAG: hypothetical protein WDO18_20955 [Acidobacteriota bacterium]
MVDIEKRSAQLAVIPRDAENLAQFFSLDGDCALPIAHDVLRPYHAGGYQGQHENEESGFMQHMPP